MPCIFCDVAQGRRPSHAVFGNDEIYAFRDLHPQAPTHVLVIPRKHIATLNDLTEEDAGLAGRMVLVAGRIAAQEDVADHGYRLVWNCNAMAGQSVYHIHLHLLGGRSMRWPPG